VDALVEARLGKPGFQHPIFIWEKNLMMVKQSLKLWAKTSFNPPTKEKQEIRYKLERFQKDLKDKEITVSLQKEEIKLQTQYQRALRHEEELWHLKSRNLWLKCW
jgi:hypothetical protein